MMVGFVLGVMVGAGIMFYVGSKFGSTEMTTKEAVEFLRQEGFWVNLNMKPEGKRK